MSKKIKYIINNGYPVLFTGANNHADYANGLTTSAGFCYIDYEKNLNGDYRFVVKCFGESIGLKLSSVPEDKKIIEMMLNEY
jgi:hypothetical protein